MSSSLQNYQYRKLGTLALEGLPKKPMSDAGASSNAPDASASAPISSPPVTAALLCPSLEVLLRTRCDGTHSEIWSMLSVSSDRSRLICASSSATLRRSACLDLHKVSQVCEQVTPELLTFVCRFLEATHRHIELEVPDKENNLACSHRTGIYMSLVSQGISIADGEQASPGSFFSCSSYKREGRDAFSSEATCEETLRFAEWKQLGRRERNSASTHNVSCV